MIPLTNGRVPSSEELLLETCARYSLGIDDLLGPDRFKTTVKARTEWWRRLRNERDMSWNEIARVAGRHHDTIRHVLLGSKRKARVA